MITLASPTFHGAEIYTYTTTLNREELENSGKNNILNARGKQYFDVYTCYITRHTSLSRKLFNVLSFFKTSWIINKCIFETSLWNKHQSQPLTYYMLMHIYYLWFLHFLLFFLFLDFKIKVSMFSWLLGPINEKGKIHISIMTNIE